MEDSDHDEWPRNEWSDQEIQEVMEANHMLLYCNMIVEGIAVKIGMKKVWLANCLTHWYTRQHAVATAKKKTMPAPIDHKFGVDVMHLRRTLKAILSFLAYIPDWDDKTNMVR